MDRLFIDLDGPTVDFDRYCQETRLTPEQVKKREGAYANMKPTPGAIIAIRELIAQGWEVWIATKPPTGIPWAYADKVRWVLKHLPELEKRIIMTHDKGMLGDAGDYLIDDRPHRANCYAFRGELIHFTTPLQWLAIVSRFRRQRERMEAAKA